MLNDSEPVLIALKSKSNYLDDLFEKYFGSKHTRSECSSTSSPLVPSVFSGPSVFQGFISRAGGGGSGKCVWGCPGQNANRNWNCKNRRKNQTRKRKNHTRNEWRTTLEPNGELQSKQVENYSWNELRTTLQTSFEHRWTLTNLRKIFLTSSTLQLPMSDLLHQFRVWFNLLHPFRVWFHLLHLFRVWFDLLHPFRVWFHLLHPFQV